MNRQEKRNAALGLAGLLALSIYILACNSSPSFSPDDTKVLYPAFDPASGVAGMSVYDREARTSEMLYQVAGYEGGSETNIAASPVLLRGQWLASGKEVVIAYLGPGPDFDEGAVTLAVMPWAGRKPIKTFMLKCESEKASKLFLALPLCVAGERLFYCAESNQVVRVDLRTCVLTKHKFEDAAGEIALCPTPDGAGVFYVEQEATPDKKTVFGRMNPEDFSRTALMAVTNRLYDELVGVFKSEGKRETVFTYDREGKMLACLKAEEGEAGEKAKVALTVWREGQVFFSRSVDTASEEMAFGNAILAASGKAVLATYAKAKGTNATTFGLMEIPFSKAAPREVTLIKEAPAGSAGGVCYFQAAVSHDGKTAAIASTYLRADEKGIKAEDCALFLVDLSDPNWKVTKVAIPMPAGPRVGLK